MSPQIDRVPHLCRELAEALIEIHPAYQKLENVSGEQQEALTVRLAKAIEQAADQEAFGAMSVDLRTEERAMNISHEQVIEGIKISVINDENDVQVWVSLADSDVPEASESFCWASGGTRAEAFAKASALFRVCEHIISSWVAGVSPARNA